MSTHRDQVNSDIGMEVNGQVGLLVNFQADKPKIHPQSTELHSLFRRDRVGAKYFPTTQKSAC